MMQPTHEQDNISDLLRDLRSHGDGFRAPEAEHFSQLSNKIVRDEGKVRALRPRTKLRKWLPYAAAAAISLLAAFTFLLPDATVRSTMNKEEALVAVSADWKSQIDALDAAEISDYIDENIEDFDLDLLAEDLTYPEQ